MTPKERAERAAHAMWREDNASRWVGMRIDDVDEGRATLSMMIEKHHTNGHGICHGGVIFMLADSAFAFACNSKNQSTVAQHNDISYIAPGRLGDRLFAEAREVSLTGRNGIYDVTVTNQKNTVIAEFRGCSRAIPGQLFEE
ncbi:Acyl-coenzyme A thioesterase PaaI [Ruegeria sp. THAF57]|uniref:hydroxyphenylacetyl-CoA thioesterase PaaI n=1 Tax=Ruegeria sp. THAF57 TaxID=2744555 RepID=UPI0015DE13F3|nr:hydroxyphenylacetyl-CoA thioesterase PaaI [Ruegeria sp. THAF57]CAD0187025.1 Acyl-coenzyme A thioesterase PaaI [Ruegeria sp. THAF57]